MNKTDSNNHEQQTNTNHSNNFENNDYSRNKTNENTSISSTQEKSSLKICNNKQHFQSNSFKNQGMYQTIQNKMTSKQNSIQQNYQKEYKNDLNRNLSQQNKFQIKYNKRLSQQIPRDFENAFNDYITPNKQYSFTPRQGKYEIPTRDEIGPWENDEMISLFSNEKISNILPNDQTINDQKPDDKIDQDTERTKQSKTNRSMRMDHVEKYSVEYIKQQNDDQIQNISQKNNYQSMSQRIISNNQIIKGEQLNSSSRSNYVIKNNQYEFNTKTTDNTYQLFNPLEQQTGVIDSFLKSIPIKKQGNLNHTKELEQEVYKQSHMFNQSSKLNFYKAHLQQNQFHTKNSHLKNSFANFLQNKMKSQQSQDVRDKHGNIIFSDEQIQTNIYNTKKQQNNILNQKTNQNEQNVKNSNYNHNKSFLGDKIILISQHINNFDDGNFNEQTNNLQNIKIENQQNNAYQNSFNSQILNTNQKQICYYSDETKNNGQNSQNSLQTSYNIKVKQITEPADLDHNNYSKRKQSQSNEFANKSIQSNFENKQIFLHYDDLTTKQNQLSNNIENIKNSLPFSEQFKRSSFKNPDLFQIFHQKTQIEDSDDRLNNSNNQYQNQSIIGQLMNKNQKYIQINRNQFQSHLKQRVINRKNNNNSEGNISLTRYNNLSNSINPNNNFDKPQEKLGIFPQFRSTKSSIGNINLQRHNQQIKEKERKQKEEGNLQKFLKSIEMNTQQINIQDNSPKLEINKSTQLKQDQLLNLNIRISGLQNAISNYHKHHRPTLSCQNYQLNSSANTNNKSLNQLNGKDVNNTDTSQKKFTTQSNYFPINSLKNKSINKNNIQFSNTPKETLHQSTKSLIGFYNQKQKVINKQIYSSPQSSIQQHSPQQPQNKNNIFIDYINLK